MKDFVKTLVGLGITVGLADRDKFVEQVSELIHEYQNDPKKADQWSKAVVDYLEQTRDNLNLQSAIKSAVAGGPLPDKEKIEELTHAIKELTKELQLQREKK